MNYTQSNEALDYACVPRCKENTFWTNDIVKILGGLNFFQLKKKE
jgi:hypothetical protein